MAPCSDERLFYVTSANYPLIGHSSVVPGSAMVPFCPGREPFQSYARNVRRFTSDLGVSRAVRYWQTGTIPEGFKWLRASTKKAVDGESEGEGGEDYLKNPDEEDIIIESTPTRRRGMANAHASGGKSKNTTGKKTSTPPTTPSIKSRSKRVEKHPSGETITHNSNGSSTGAPPILRLPSYREPRKFHLLASLLPADLPR